MNGSPSVTVLVTAHDAEETIGPCLRALADSRDVPGGFEMLVIDDRSADRTGEMARAVAGVRVHRIDRFDGGPLTARQAAIDAGVVLARGRVVVVTDADARPTRDWVRSIVDPIERGEADVVAGSVAFTATNARTRALASLQTVDAAFYLSACEALARSGAPSGLLFGAAAFRRDAFLALGGFAAIGPALTEDLAFARAAHEAGLRLAFVPRPAVPVRACASWREIVERARRTSVGGLSLLAAMLGAWVLALPVLLVASLSGLLAPRWLVLRWLVGASLAAIATVRTGRLRDAWAALLYEAFALATGVRVLLTLRRSTAIEWGGLTYQRAAPGERPHVA